MAWFEVDNSFTMVGVAVVLMCSGHREIMVVDPIGCETDSDVATKAYVAARNGYPSGTIDIVEIRPKQRWFVCGLPADESNECHWQS